MTGPAEPRAGAAGRGDSAARQPGRPPTLEPQRRREVVVVGSGVAGLSVAIRLATAGVAVTVLTKDAGADGATVLAQGGIAVALDATEDSPGLHHADTMNAGAGLCDPDAVTVLVEEGPRRVRELIASGAVFDTGSSGDLERSREGGHSRARVVHAAGAATGAEVERALLAALARSGAELVEGSSAAGLTVANGRCAGVSVLDRTGALATVDADRVVLATGGIGRLFAVTTSPLQSTGDGLALALRAGVPVADVEFVQFHPTALAVESFPRPLMSEALRGEGALLLDPSGRRFVDELAPRDVVSRAIAAVMAEQGTDHVYLDARSLEGFAARFPGLHGALAQAGLDPAVDLLPVAPAAHYLCGGVLTDLDGASALPGLWAVGEVACNGVHGANRLASNSLLDGLVFGARAADAILAGRESASATGVFASSVPLRLLGPASSPPEAHGDTAPEAPGGAGHDAARATAELQAIFSTHVGVVRDGAGLAFARRSVDRLAAAAAAGGDGARAGTERPVGELEALLAVGAAVVDAARQREESRGAHTRAEWAGPRPEWRSRLVHGDPALLGAVLEARREEVPR